MKVAKLRKKNEIKSENESQNYSIKAMIKILICLLIVFTVFYFVTVILVNNKKEVADNSTSVIDSSKITLNQLLTRSESEYYVIATMPSMYKSSYMNTSYIELYNEHINNYKQKDSSLSFYYIDLDNALNKKNVGQNLNIVDDIQNLELNDEVLFKIKNRSIEKYYVGKDKILDKLSRL